MNERFRSGSCGTSGIPEQAKEGAETRSEDTGSIETRCERVGRAAIMASPVRAEPAEALGR